MPPTCAGFGGWWPDAQGCLHGALGVTVEGQLRIIVAMRDAVDQLEAEMAVAFDAHELAPILRSVPGLGPVLAARVLWTVPALVEGGAYSAGS